MDIDFPIIAVTVYQDRARVTRRNTVELEVGTHELTVQDLTLLLDPDSVRASGEGTARVRLLGVDVRRTFFTETPSVPAADLKRRLQEKLDGDQVLQDEATLLDSQLGMLTGISEHAGENLARGIGLGRAKVADGDALLSFVGAQHAQFSGRKREIAVRRRELAAEIKVLEMELKRLAGASPRERYTATIGLEVLTDGQFALELEYTTIGGAHWRPQYDLRLIEGVGEPRVELTYLGQVQQSTGEDWPNVDLTLSTARPAVSAELPKLSPWYIQVYEPLATRRGGRDRLRRAPAGATKAALDEGAEMEEALGGEDMFMAAEPLQAEVDVSGAAVAYHIPRKAEIPADNTPHETTVRVLEFRPELDYLTVPKLIDEVYRRAKVVNDSQVTLLPGAVSLFHGGEFVGRATLPLVAPQEEFETTLGIDDRITAVRKLVLKEVAKQFIGDRRLIRYAYETEVKNLLPRPAKVVVGDQLPVAGHEDIRVKAEEIDPPPTGQSEQGELTWELGLQPQESRTLRFEFTVSAPRNQTLVGLPED